VQGLRGSPGGSLLMAGSWRSAEKYVEKDREHTCGCGCSHSPSFMATRIQSGAPIKWSYLILITTKGPSINTVVRLGFHSLDVHGTKFQHRKFRKTNCTQTIAVCVVGFDLQKIFFFWIFICMFLRDLFFTVLWVWYLWL
jgi:hypothetical protein